MESSKKGRQAGWEGRRMQEKQAKEGRPMPIQHSKASPTACALPWFSAKNLGYQNHIFSLLFGRFDYTMIAKIVAVPPSLVNADGDCLRVLLLHCECLCVIVSILTCPS
jgi:hypothetical protein